MSAFVDQRSITTGYDIPTESYADQPYVVQTEDGAWLCVVTTGSGREGESGQHVATLRSTDGGRTWSSPVALEPPDGPEASYAVLLKVPAGYPLAGRVYCFYNHNTDNIREVKTVDAGSWFPDGLCRRVDSLGHFVCKYSDDGGLTWSQQRYDLPMRLFEIDRENVYGGDLLFFWNVGKPFAYQGAAYVSLHKVGGFGVGFFTRSEGVLLKSTNLFTEPDPAKLQWETLPDGEVGLRTPPGGGPIAEEQSYSVLSDGSFYCVYRTTDGHPACSYSRDGGHTWGEPQYQRYANRRLFKHPRAANFCWRCENGHYLYWFHNHGGTWYEDRNPVWLSGGVEADSPEGKVIVWSQPEIVLYDDDPYVRMSYPDLVQCDGHYYLTETQKEQARVHEIDLVLLAGLWSQATANAVSQDGLVLELPKQGEAWPTSVPEPELPEFTARDNSRSDYGTQDLRQGFTIDLWLKLDSLCPGQMLLDSRTSAGQGFCVRTTERETLELVLNDGRTENRWDCDPGALTAGALQHVVMIVDGGPKIIVFVVDGVVSDGGDARQFGWGRYSPQLRGVSGAETLRLGSNLLQLRIYDRALRISEAISHCHAGVASR